MVDLGIFEGSLKNGKCTNIMVRNYFNMFADKLTCMAYRDYIIYTHLYELRLQKGFLIRLTFYRNITTRNI